MAFSDQYRKQVSLLVKALPHVAQEPCFALKGGTALRSQKLLSRPGPIQLIKPSPQAAASQCQILLAPEEQEVFYAIWLNSQHQIIHHGELSRGTIDGASVYPREVVKTALACNAAAVIFAHNHPSGHAEPSQADIQITKRLKEALSLIDIRVLDHMIVAENVLSMAERGLL